MTTTDNDDRFETRLLDNLHTYRASATALATIPQRSRARRPLAIGAGLAASAALAAALIALQANPAAAYTLHDQPDGTIEVEIRRSLTASDLMSLQRDLAQAGAQNTVTCDPSRQIQLEIRNLNGRPVTLTADQAAATRAKTLGTRNLDDVANDLHTTVTAIAGCAN